MVFAQSMQGELGDGTKRELREWVPEMAIDRESDGEVMKRNTFCLRDLVL